MHVYLKSLALCFFLSFVLIGCSPSTGQQGTGAYPADKSANSLPAAYPVDKSNLPSTLPAYPSVIPTPIQTKGMIIGQLTNDPQDTLLGALYLGTILPITPGPGYLINLDPQNSPSAKSYASGKFIFFNVPPGQYAIIWWTPHDSRFIAESDNPSKELVVTVEAGKILDIGSRTIAIR